MEKNDYIIRKATLEDCKDLAILKRKVWETTYKGIYPDEKIDNYNYEENENKFIKIINDKEIELYIVELDNQLIGYMDYGKPYRGLIEIGQEIGLLYILKEYQGLGIGKKLFNLAYDEIKNRGYKQFFISCNKYNVNAQKFYEAMGGEIKVIDDDNIDKSIPQVYFVYQIN